MPAHKLERPRDSSYSLPRPSEKCLLLLIKDPSSCSADKEHTHPRNKRHIICNVGRILNDDSQRIQKHVLRLVRIHVEVVVGHGDPHAKEHQDERHLIRIDLRLLLNKSNECIEESRYREHVKNVKENKAVDAHLICNEARNSCESKSNRKKLETSLNVITRECAADAGQTDEKHDDNGMNECPEPRTS